jgi:hypothetical protein
LVGGGISKNMNMELPTVATYLLDRPNICMDSKILALYFLSK